MTWLFIKHSALSNIPCRKTYLITHFACHVIAHLNSFVNEKYAIALNLIKIYCYKENGNDLRGIDSFFDNNTK